MRNSDYDVNEVMLNTRVCKEENNEIVSHSPILNKCVPTSLFQVRIDFIFDYIIHLSYNKTSSFASILSCVMC